MLSDNSTKTVKILSLDGGGMRGYLSATFLKRFCQQAGIAPNEIFKSFDIITGTSIGGLQALAYASGKSPDEMRYFFETKGASIFAYSSILPLSGYKFAVIMGLPFQPNTFYGQEPLREALIEIVGTDKTLSNLPTNVLIPTWNASKDEGTIYSNITGLEPFLTGSNVNLVDAGLSTSAAPLYFPPSVVNNEEMIDGGVFVNNPVTLAYSVAKKIYPGATRFCVLSVGTGYTQSKFVPDVGLRSQGLLGNDPVTLEFQSEMLKIAETLQQKYPEHAQKIDALTASNSLAPYNVQYLFYLLDNVFIEGPQEFNAKTMTFNSWDLFDDVFFYRFQYQFQDGQDASLDNYSPEQITALGNYANQQYDTDALEIASFIGHLNGGT